MPKYSVKLKKKHPHNSMQLTPNIGVNYDAQVFDFTEEEVETVLKSKCAEAWLEVKKVTPAAKITKKVSSKKKTTKKKKED